MAVIRRVSELQATPVTMAESESESAPGPEWSQLQTDILLRIAASPTDVLRLRSICKSWRSSIPLTHSKTKPYLPLPLPFPISPYPHDNKDDGFLPEKYVLTESTIFALKDPTSDAKPWLFRAEESNNQKFHPLHPLSKHLTKQVPTDFPLELNLLDFRVFEISKCFNLEFVLDDIHGKNNIEHIYKVCVSSSPYGDRDYVIMAIANSKLGFIKLGDKKWNTIDDSQWLDIVFHKGQFYAVDAVGKTVVICLDFKIKEVANPVPCDKSESQKYLVSFGDDLFVIDWCRDCYTFTENYEGVEFQLKCFKMNENEGRWEPVDSLGDKAFFVGGDASFVVSALDFPGLKSNCIYIVDEVINEYESHFLDLCVAINGDEACSLMIKDLGDLCAEIGVFNLEDGLGRPLAYFPLCFSQIFWPPPAWLLSKSRSSNKRKNTSFPACNQGKLRCLEYKSS